MTNFTIAEVPQCPVCDRRLVLGIQGTAKCICGIEHYINNNSIFVVLKSNDATRILKHDGGNRWVTHKGH